jgi:hypothetical protein
VIPGSTIQIHRDWALDDSLMARISLKLNLKLN